MGRAHRPSLKHQFWKMVNRKKGYAELVLRKEPNQLIGLVLQQQLPIYNFDNDSVDYIWRWFASTTLEDGIHVVGRKTTGYEKQSEAVKAITDAYEEAVNARKRMDKKNKQARR